MATAAGHNLIRLSEKKRASRVGASNAIRAYAVYGAVLDHAPMRVLVYMALVARDGDGQPWFRLGHEAIAELALGRAIPADDPKERDAILRSVRKTITKLADAGAIRTSKRAVFGSRGTQFCEYRLYLDAPCDDGRRTAQEARSPDSEGPMPPEPQGPMAPVDNQPGNPVDNPRPQELKGPMAAEAIGTSGAGHRNLRVRPQEPQGPTKEEEEEEERITKEQISVRRTVEDSPLSTGEPPAAGSVNGSAPSPIELAARRAAQAAVDQSRRARGAQP